MSTTRHAVVAQPLSPKGVGSLMQNWHASAGDPIYIVGSNLAAGRRPTPEAIRGAKRNIDRLLATEERREEECRPGSSQCRVAQENVAELRSISGFLSGLERIDNPYGKKRLKSSLEPSSAMDRWHKDGLAPAVDGERPKKKLKSVQPQWVMDQRAMYRQRDEDHRSESQFSGRSENPHSAVKKQRLVYGSRGAVKDLSPKERSAIKNVLGHHSRGDNEDAVDRMIAEGLGNPRDLDAYLVKEKARERTELAALLNAYDMQFTEASLDKIQAEEKGPGDLEDFFRNGVLDVEDMGWGVTRKPGMRRRWERPRQGNPSPIKVRIAPGKRITATVTDVGPTRDRDVVETHEREWTGEKWVEVPGTRKKARQGNPACRCGAPVAQHKPMLALPPANRRENPVPIHPPDAEAKRLGKMTAEKLREAHATARRQMATAGSDPSRADQASRRACYCLWEADRRGVRLDRT